MDRAPALPEVSPHVGALLAEWRRRRRLSQLELCLRAEVSTKHVSFIETGRANPSRALIVDLCEALDVPLRARNQILLAGGFSPLYRATPLDDEAMATAREALALMLEAVQPCGAVAFDDAWNVVMVNRPYLAWVGHLLPRPVPPLTVVDAPRPNLLQLLFAADGFRQMVSNWDAVAAAVSRRVHRELATQRNDELREVVEQLGSSGPLGHKAAPWPSAVAALLPVELRLGTRTLRLINTISTLGAAVDLTLRELRIETFHPASAADRVILHQRFG